MSNDAVKGYGYFGKVPFRGDFVSDRLGQGLIESFNDWIQAGIAVSQEQLLDNWMEAYLTAPVWHFALSRGVVADDAVIGSLMPSVDQVGRHFPFMLATTTALTPARAWSQRQWSDLTGDHLLRVLDDGQELSDWVGGLDSLQLPVAVEGSSLKPRGDFGKRQLAWEAGAATANDELLHPLLRHQYPRYCLWWTQGSELVPESLLISSGLPQVSQFAAMIDGQFEHWGW
ncbi:type VI secretion system-associated protein TagF [Pokkaliibacter sp. CJK22405]|uniref:type VI secretion system-associated protein TagF n=1 Tax=Pokkaliibacter sp. CJK22405 TaxID=3384615 RepID=UPI003984A684